LLVIVRAKVNGPIGTRPDALTLWGDGSALPPE